MVIIIIIYFYYHYLLLLSLFIIIIIIYYYYHYSLLLSLFIIIIIIHYYYHYLLLLSLFIIIIIIYYYYHYLLLLSLFIIYIYLYFAKATQNNIIRIETKIKKNTHILHHMINVHTSNYSSKRNTFIIITSNETMLRNIQDINDIRQTKMSSGCINPLCDIDPFSVRFTYKL